MRTHKLMMIIATMLMVGGIITGVVNADNLVVTRETKAQLQNVRDYAVAPAAGTVSYAVDGGVLFAGNDAEWIELKTPKNVIVSAVAAVEVVDQEAPTLYIGAANEMAIYRSVDGKNWLRIPLTEEYIGGVTDIAVDALQRIVYVGTDTAGLFRLRDVGSSMVVGGHLLLTKPVLEVVADSAGSGMAFVRTETQLYRAEEYGLSWVAVENLNSLPTALAIAPRQAGQASSTIYVGTMDRGVLQSHDGLGWESANQGLDMAPGTRLKVNDLAINPAQPDVVYVATSYLLGSTEVHETPATVAMGTIHAEQTTALAWQPLNTIDDLYVVELLPVAETTGAIYALTSQSRSPQLVGEAETLPSVETVAVPTTPAASQSTGILAWIVAALAGMALVYAVASDLSNRREAKGETIAAPVRIR